MDTQNTSNPVSWLSLAKKHFKPKTIEVMVATTPPLMQDRKLPRSTYRYVHVRACLHTKHVIHSIRFYTETLDVDLRTSSLFFEGKQRIRRKIYIQIIHYFH